MHGDQSGYDLEVQLVAIDEKKNIEIQPGFEPGSSEYSSHQLSQWSSGIGAEDRWYLSIDTA